MVVVLQRLTWQPRSDGSLEQYITFLKRVAAADRRNNGIGRRVTYGHGMVLLEVRYVIEVCIVLEVCDGILFESIV